MLEEYFGVGYLGLEESWEGSEPENEAEVVAE